MRANSVTDNHRQKQSDAYRLPALDQDFILGDSMRGVRFLLEYAKAEQALRAHGIASTVVVFGSSRARNGSGGPPLTAGGHEWAGPHSQHWYDEARRFGRIVSERGGALNPVDGKRYNVIATGGGPGVMEAANRGARDAGAPSIGFNIALPQTQEPNAYSTPELTFQFHYFAMRKMHLAMRAAALAVFPGGFGTFDELFEVLTLVQTHKAPAAPVLCFDRKFWTSVINFDALIAAGTVSQSDLALMTFVEDAEEAWAALVKAGLLDHRK
jgi:uncharacterized protein (TIGR00730 family)